MNINITGTSVRNQLGLDFETTGRFNLKFSGTLAINKLTSHENTAETLGIQCFQICDPANTVAVGAFVDYCTARWFVSTPTIDL